MNIEKIVMWKKSDTKGHMLYDSIYVTCPEQVNPCDRDRVVAARAGEAEWLLNVRLPNSNRLFLRDLMQTDLNYPYTL